MAASPSAVILEPQKIKSVTVSIVSPSIYHEGMGEDAMIFIFLILSFKQAFSLSSFSFIKRLFSSYTLSAIRVVPSVYLSLLIFLRMPWPSHDHSEMTLKDELPRSVDAQQTIY